MDEEILRNQLTEQLLMEAVESITGYYFRNFNINSKLSVQNRQKYYVEFEKFAKSMSTNITEVIAKNPGDMVPLAETIEKDMVRLGNWTKYQEDKYQEILGLEKLEGYETYVLFI